MVTNFSASLFLPSKAIQMMSCQDGTGVPSYAKLQLANTTSNNQRNTAP